MKYVSLLILIALLTACAPKFYARKDYSFYDKQFRNGALPRTDGIYVTAPVWAEQQQKTVQLKEKRMYRFYPGGQYNMILNQYRPLNNEEDYLNAIREHHANHKTTLFEGYFRLRDQRIILQGIINRPKQFIYEYGYFSKDSLIIIKGGGNGKFQEKNFTEYIRHPYVFVPLDTTELNKFPANW